MITPTLTQFKTWARANRSLAEAVCMAQAFAECERERVDAYIRPVFDRYTFIDEQGKRITKPRDLFMSADDATEFYAACDVAHRENGFTGESGYCPALIAESMLIDAQNALIKSGAALLGIDGDIYGEHRKKMLDLLLGACLTKAA